MIFSGACFNQKVILEQEHFPYLFFLLLSFIFLLLVLYRFLKNVMICKESTRPSFVCTQTQKIKVSILQ